VGILSRRTIVALDLIMMALGGVAAASIPGAFVRRVVAQGALPRNADVARLR
jgi:hypothetical protein